jgi:DNA polymerase
MSNQQNYFNPILLQPDFTPEVLKNLLRKQGCDGCDLGLQDNFRGPVVFRGNPQANHIVIGEAPGLREDIDGIPFTGPAGKLLEKMWKGMGWDLEKDWYVTNVLHCRPVAPAGSGRQNLTPKVQQIKNCRPYIVHEIKSLNPTVVVLLGAVATKSILPKETEGRNQTQLVGKIFYGEEFPGVTFFTMFHPAYLLRSQGSERYPQLRKDSWDHAKLLKEIINELG